MLLLYLYRLNLSRLSRNKMKYLRWTCLLSILRLPLRGRKKISMCLPITKHLRKTQSSQTTTWLRYNTVYHHYQILVTSKNHSRQVRVMDTWEIVSIIPVLRRWLVINTIHVLSWLRLHPREIEALHHRTGWTTASAHLRARHERVPHIRTSCTMCMPHQVHWGPLSTLLQRVPWSTRWNPIRNYLG